MFALNDRLHAIATPPSFSIEAALASPEVRAVMSLMASAGVERPTGKIALADLDRRLKGSGLEPAKRIQIKIALERAGIAF